VKSVCSLAGNSLICTAGNTANYCVRPLSSTFSPPWQRKPNPLCSTGGQCFGTGQQFNNNTCSCGRPLICHMQLTSPLVQNINDNLMTTIQNEWAQNLYLQNASQVFISSAQFTNDNHLDYNMSLFAASGDSLNSSQVEGILNNLTNSIHHINEGPSLLLSFIRPFGQGKPRKSFGTQYRKNIFSIKRFINFKFPFSKHM
jgi:hypothetical protein